MTGGEKGALVAQVTHVDPRNRPGCQRYTELISTPLAKIRKFLKEELVTRYDELLALKAPPCSVQQLHEVGPSDYLTVALVASEFGWLHAITAH
jgi:hypothetical protein